MLKCLSEWCLNYSINKINTWIDATQSPKLGHTITFNFFSPPRYRKCERIEKAKISRVLKPLKGMYLVG